jgi:membrane-bound ClpP family serine protease
MDERKRVKPAKGEWPYVVLGVFLFFGTIFLFVTEIDNFPFTTNLNFFVILFGIIGLLLAIALSIHYGKGTKGIERSKLTLLFVIFVTLIVPVWAHFINRTIVIQSHNENVEVFENSLSDLTLNPKLVEATLENGFYLFLAHKQRLLKVKTKREEHLAIKEGDLIEVTLCRGIFGFEFVDDQKFK